MTCIKTGAKVLIEDLGCVVAADIYEVGDCVVIRSTIIDPDDFEPRSNGGMMPTHVLSSDIRGREFWRGDIGVFVVTSDKLIEVKE